MRGRLWVSVIAKSEKCLTVFDEGMFSSRTVLSFAKRPNRPDIFDSNCTVVKPLINYARLDDRVGANR